MTFAIGPLGVAALGMLTLPILTWIFPQEDIGRISLLHVVISFTVLFCSLGLDQSYVRDYHESDNKPGLLNTVVIPSTLLLVLLFACTVFVPSSLAELIFDFRGEGVDVMLFLCLLTSFFSRYLSLVVRMQERGLAFSISQILPKLVFLLIIACYLISPITLDFFYLMLAQTISFLLTFLILAFITREEWIVSLRQRFNHDEFKSAIVFGFPLVFSGVAFWGLTAVDRFFIIEYSSYIELGLYSVAVSFAGAAMILKTIFSILWAPTVYKWLADGEDMGKVDNVTELLLFIVAVSFCLFGLGSWLVSYILPSEYANVEYLVVASVGFPLFYTLAETSGIGISVVKKSLYNLYTSLIALIINVALNLVLIPNYGASGAAAATIVSFWVFLFFRTLFSRILWREFPVMKLYTVTFFCMILSIFHLFIAEELEIYIYLSWLIFLFIILFNFRRSLVEIINKVKQLGN